MAPPKQTRPRGWATPTAIAAGLLGLTGCYLWFLGGTNPARVETVGGPFHLTEADGTTVSDRSFRGRYMLVYFGYTSCQDVCPATLTAVARALDILGPRGATVQPIFVTVDPERDTPAVLRAYLAAFTPRLIGLTGTARQLRAVRREYRISVVAHRGGPAVRDMSVDHSSVLLLIGPDGRYLAPIRADEPAAELAADIAAQLGRKMSALVQQRHSAGPVMPNTLATSVTVRPRASMICLLTNPPG